MGFPTEQRRFVRVALACAIGVALAGCEDGFQMPFGQGAGGASPAAQRRGDSTLLVERDVEAPGVFQVTDQGLWDGRPSLGGVWVAHPDAEDPERVIIRNEENGRFVIGALFRRERENPGPILQVSSDAAAALGMVAGAPTQMSVTALRREEVAGEGEDNPVPATAAPSGGIETREIDPISAATAAIEQAEATAPASTLDRPFIQIGIFSLEQNAHDAAARITGAGMTPKVLAQTSQGKAFWRVIVGPASDASDRAAQLTTIKGIGFADAYPVTN